MTVLSTNRISSSIGLGLVGVGTVAVALCLHQRSLNKKKQQEDAGSPESEANVSAPMGIETQSMRGDAESHSHKTRIGNFKISKVMNLVEGIAADLDVNVEFDWHKASQGGVQTSRDAHSLEQAIDTNDETEWERQASNEARTFANAHQIMKELRQSETHRKLQHFHVVDRQLSQMEAQFAEVSERILEFPWREHRDDPLSDIMKIPFMSLAADHSQQAVLPVSQGFVKKVGMKSDAKESKSKQAANKVEDEKDLAIKKGEDEALFGIAADATQEELQSAFRHKSRDMHSWGQCTKIDDFHELNNAYARCLARLANSGWKNAYRGGSTDILAHYLLIGTDPSESRYGEASMGLLDALQRDRLLTRLDVLRSWGEVSGTTTGLGNG